MTIQYLTHGTTTQQTKLERTLNDLRTTQATKVSKILSILDIDDKAIALQLIKEYSRDKSTLSTKKSKAKHPTGELNLELMDLLELPPEESKAIVHIPEKPEIVQSLPNGVSYKPLDYDRGWLIALCEPELKQFTKNMIKQSYAAHSIQVLFK